MNLLKECLERHDRNKPIFTMSVRNNMTSDIVKDLGFKKSFSAGTWEKKVDDRDEAESVANEVDKFITDSYGDRKSVV